MQTFVIQVMVIKFWFWLENRIKKHVKKMYLKWCSWWLPQALKMSSWGELLHRQMFLWKACLLLFERQMAHRALPSRTFRRTPIHWCHLYNWRAWTLPPWWVPFSLVPLVGAKTTPSLVFKISIRSSTILI